MPAVGRLSAAEVRPAEPADSGDGRLIAVTLVAAAAVSTWQAVVARTPSVRPRPTATGPRLTAIGPTLKGRQARQKSTATTEAAIARAVNDFLQGDLLGQAKHRAPSSSEVEGEPYLTVREALDRASARIGDASRISRWSRRRSDDDRRGLREPGRDELAVDHLERAVELRRITWARATRQPSAAEQGWPTLTPGWAGVPEAVPIYERLLEIAKTRLGPDDPELLLRMNQFAGAFGERGTGRGAYG